jgi:hypothetical protein
VSDHDDGLARPRHRKSGRASKRGSGLPGRHLQVVTDEDRTDQDSSLPGAYPVEDLAGMSASAIEMLLHRATVEARNEGAALPHIVITRDVVTGVITESGPFDSGLEALTVAHDFVSKYRDLHPRWDYTLTVAPLLGQK